MPMQFLKTKEVAHSKLEKTKQIRNIFHNIFLPNYSNGFIEWKLGTSPKTFPRTRKSMPAHSDNFLHNMFLWTPTKQFRQPTANFGSSNANFLPENTQKRAMKHVTYSIDDSAEKLLLRVQKLSARTLIIFSLKLFLDMQKSVLLTLPSVLLSESEFLTYQNVSLDT